MEVPMKLRKARHSRRGRIEIIPMIDVMFFLLATFMLASLSLQNLHSLPVNLPQGKAAPIQAKTPSYFDYHERQHNFAGQDHGDTADTCGHLAADAQWAGLKCHCGGRQCSTLWSNRSGYDAGTQCGCTAFSDSGQK